MVPKSGPDISAAELEAQAAGAVVLNESIELSPYDPAWPGLADRERWRLAETLDVSVGTIEHIGSTAVPDLVAKPIIDLMLGVESFPPSGELLDTCRGLGYESLGEAGVPGRLYLRRRGPESYNLHVVLRGSNHWRGNLAFRELLRSDPVARKQYALAKADALRSGRTTLLEYSDAKSAAIRELLSGSAVALQEDGQGRHHRDSQEKP